MPETADLDIDAPAVAVDAVSREFQQLVAAQHLAGPLQKSEKQVVLGAREGDQGSGRGCQLPPDEVQSPSGKTVLMRCLDDVGVRAGRAAKNGPDAGEEFSGLNGFGR